MRRPDDDGSIELRTLDSTSFGRSSERRLSDEWGDDDDDETFLLPKSVGLTLERDGSGPLLRDLYYVPTPRCASARARDLSSLSNAQTHAGRYMIIQTGGSTSAVWSRRCTHAHRRATARRATARRAARSAARQRAGAAWGGGRAEERRTRHDPQ